MKRKHYVFRINYDYAYSKLREELCAGRLRQGWGGPGFDLKLGEDAYVDAYKSVWGLDGKSESDIRKRYHYLEPMLKMEVGDLIVIPKMNVLKKTDYLPRVFTIAEVIDVYRFEELEDMGDFGHVIPVKTINSFSYDHDNCTRIVQGSLSGYQKCVNNVVSDIVIKAVDQLYSDAQAETKNRQRFLDSSDLMQVIDDATIEAKEKYINSLVETIQNWSGNTFEKVLDSLFAKQGYVNKAKNSYDRKGGDVDLWYPAYPLNTLMGDILEGSEVNSLPEIRIQAKCKIGSDTKDIEGIRQLKDYAGPGSEDPAINIFITTSNEISDEAKKEADGCVILIDAEKLASLLMKYGIGNDMF